MEDTGPPAAAVAEARAMLAAAGIALPDDEVADIAAGLAALARLLALVRADDPAR
jgi:hypothetical protein